MAYGQPFRPWDPGTWAEDPPGRPAPRRSHERLAEAPDRRRPREPAACVRWLRPDLAAGRHARGLPVLTGRHLRRHHRAVLVHALDAQLGRALLRVPGESGAAMTRPWQHSPEDQIVAVVHALQELLVCVTDPSEL